MGREGEQFETTPKKAEHRACRDWLKNLGKARKGLEARAWNTHSMNPWFCSSPRGSGRNQLCPGEPLGVSHTSWVQPPTEFTSWSGSLPAGNTPQLKTHRFQSDFARLGRQNPPLSIQKWEERGEIQIPPSEHKRIAFPLHPTLPSPPSLHFLLLF